jgi:nitrate/nitrite transporter NarK
MALGALGVILSLQAGNFALFFASFMFLFIATGMGNASTFQMIPIIMRKEIARLEPSLSANELLRQSEKESAAITGFTSAIAAYGAFFIPMSFRLVDFGIWQRCRRPYRVPYFLRHLHHSHLACIHAQGRSSA